MSMRMIQLCSGAVHNATYGGDRCQIGKCLNKRLNNGTCFSHQPAPVYKPKREDKMYNSGRADWHVKT